MTKTISRWTRLHHLLHRCSWCWRRSSFTLTMRGEDMGGQPTGDPLVFHVCEHHAYEAQKALMPIAETATVTFENGGTMTFSGHVSEGGDRE